MMLVWTVTGFGEGSCKASAWLLGQMAGCSCSTPFSHNNSWGVMNTMKQYGKAEDDDGGVRVDERAGGRGVGNDGSVIHAERP